MQNKWLVALLSAATLVAYTRMAWLDWQYGTLRAAVLPQTIAWYLLAFVAYASLLILNERRPLGTWWVWAGAILWRLILLLTVPTLSDDVYRYLWDGHVAASGVNPYAYAIDAPELDYLDIPQRALANNTWMASPYMPTAQALFYTVAALFPLHPFYLQAIMLLLDLGTAYVLSRLLALTQLPERRLFLYLWNPLVILEIAHGAHIDALMVFLTVGAILASDIGDRQLGAKVSETAAAGTALRAKVKSLWSPLLLSLATLTKLLPLLILPVFFWLWDRGQRLLYALFCFLILLPFGVQAGWGITGDLDGRGVFGALRIYAGQWRFNSGLFHWFELGLRRQVGGDSEAVAKGVVAALMLVLLTAVWLLARKHHHPRAALRLMSLPLMAYIVLTPTLHPWYLLMLLAFVPFLTPAEGEPPSTWLMAAPWLYLGGVLIFSYLAYLDPNEFNELAWVRLLEWVPTLGMLAAAGITYLAHRNDSTVQKKA